MRLTCSSLNRMRVMPENVSKFARKYLNSALLSSPISPKLVNLFVSFSLLEAVYIATPVSDSLQELPQQSVPSFRPVAQNSNRFTFKNTT